MENKFLWILLALLMCIVVLQTSAQQFYPTRYGKRDELGKLKMICIMHLMGNNGNLQSRSRRRFNVPFSLLYQVPEEGKGFIRAAGTEEARARLK